MAALETPRVLLVAPSSPPYGGMALQAQLLRQLLSRDGQPVCFVASNFPLPKWVQRVSGLRAAVRFGGIWPKLWRAASQAEVMHVFAASWFYFYAVVWPAVVVGRMLGIRIVLNYRGGEAGRFFRWNGWAAWPVFRMATVVTAPSHFLASLLRERFRVPVAIVPNPLDTAAFRYRDRARICARFVVARHLEPIYDIESVLKAFRAIQQRRPEASLIIAGTGSQEGHLRGLASAWKLENVRFLGHVAHDDLPGIYEDCDIFLNASRVDNFPGALIEASAAGLVIVSTGAGGIPYIYEQETSALLTSPGAWQELAEAAEKVLSNPALARTLRQRALDIVRGCDWAEVRQALYEAYGLTPKNDSLDRTPAAGAVR